MGQKTNPIGLRLGIIRGWDANWFDEQNFAEKLHEDIKVRNYIKNRLRKAGVSRIVIERTTKLLRITIHSSRPGLIIGRSGQEISKLEEEIRRLTNKEVKILISEVKKPELEAVLVAENIASQIEGRVSFRRAMKMAVSNAMKMGAVGIKVQCSGRLGGAEMARSEQYKDGRIPLHTLRADIDYGFAVAQTIYGSIGVKVWICRGEILGKPQLA
ncbi:MAG: 30S ribosomal protein S3 [Candidatus Kapaibacteriota bacterium]